MQDQLNRQQEYFYDPEKTPDKIPDKKRDPF